LVLFLPALASAQTPITRGPVPAGARVAYETPDNVTTLTQAASFEARFYRNGTPLTALVNVSCAPAVAPLVGFTCTSVLTPSNIDALNQVGVHALTLSLFRQDVGEGPHGAPFTLTTPAGVPRGGRLFQ